MVVLYSAYVCIKEFASFGTLFCENTCSVVLLDVNDDVKRGFYIHHGVDDDGNGAHFHADEEMKSVHLKM